MPFRVKDKFKHTIYIYFNQFHHQCLSQGLTLGLFAWSLQHCTWGKGGEWNGRRYTGVGGRWKGPLNSFRKQVCCFNPDVCVCVGGKARGFYCAFWEYNETGVPQGGTDRKDLASHNPRVLNMLLSKGWVIGWSVSPSDQLANSSGSWDLSSQVGNSRLWTWAPHSSVLPNRGQRKWIYIDLRKCCRSVTRT